MLRAFMYGVVLLVVAQLHAWNPVVAAALELDFNSMRVDITGAGRVEVGSPSRSLEFSLDVEFEPGPPAMGGMSIALSDGAVRFYEPVTGAVLRGQECLIFFLLRSPYGGLDPTEPAVLTAREDPRRPGVIFVKLRLQQAFPHTLSFEVPGDLQLTHSDPQPPASISFEMRYPPQRVTIADNGIAAVFSARIKALHDHVASGYLTLHLPDDQPIQFYEPLFATPVKESATGTSYIVILLAAEDVPLTIEALAIATVHPNPELPGCDIWDFESNNVVGRRGSAFRIVFDAQGRVRFAPERAGSGPAGIR
jgi:hypothetical protein